jgi:hypothetical protein
MAKTITCPHCQKDVKLDIQYTVDVASELSDVNETDWRGAWLATLNPQDQDAVKRAIEGGLIEPFAAAVLEAHGQVVRRSERAFLAWLRTAKAKIVPQFAVDYFAEQYGGQITYIAGQSVAAVLSDGYFKEFIPDKTVCGSSVKAGSGKLRVSQGSLIELMNWTRTKFGYVAGKGALHSQLSRRSYGDFARPSI